MEESGAGDEKSGGVDLLGLNKKLFGKVLATSCFDGLTHKSKVAQLEV